MSPGWMLILGYLFLALGTQVVQSDGLLVLLGVAGAIAFVNHR
ncbi:MAG: hypothetical protein Q8P02_02570 [Candidatus Micrarchaeota archaeon]|nr:hypothetical protein [Candidatus Micrarchaeota archaeon]